MTSIQEPDELRAEIREIASRINDDARMRLVTMKPGYDTIDLGEALIGRLLLAERNRAYEECAGRAAARQAIYEKKRTEADPLAKDEYTRWEKYDFAVEAMEYMEAAIRALLK